MQYIDENGDFLYEPIMTEKNIMAYEKDLRFVTYLEENQRDTTSPIIVFFGYHEDTGLFTIGHPSFDPGTNGIAQIAGICNPRRRNVIAEIRRPVGFFGTDIDTFTTARVSISIVIRSKKNLGINQRLKKSRNTQ